MIIIIPLGGEGIRFSSLGYIDPKPLVKVHGKEIIFYLLDSIKTKKNDKIYIIYNHKLEQVNFVERLAKYKNLNFLKLSKKTSGPVETVFELTNQIEKTFSNEKILIMDGDTFYKKNIINEINQKYHSIFYHITKIKDPIFSYLKNKGRIVKDIAEKKKISDNACTGAYFFNSINTFNKYAKLTLKKNKASYISDIYKSLIRNNKIVKSIKVLNKNFACLGTPNQIIDFSFKNKIEKKRFCFDLDNTLVTFPKITGDYSTVEPIEKNIKFLNFLKKLGHHITIYTARKMRTHNGDVKKVEKEIKNLTLEQLNKFRIKYDQIIFGKPYAHFYIDDLAINPFQNLNIKLGYYEKKDSLSRSFNEIIIGEKYSIKSSKKMNLIQNQIKYLKKLPKSFLNFFPKLISNGSDWYKMETINGVNFSYLFINNLMSFEDIDTIMSNLSKIHSFKKFSKKKINIYENYLIKLERRIKKYKKIYIFKKNNLKKLKKSLKNYEKNNQGSEGFIHGDTVLSNIIKDYSGNIKFIDPKGAIGDKFSHYGDIFYDYAKLYQSLNGYENIIYEKKINLNYLSKIKYHFEEKFILKFNREKLQDLKYLTASLYYSLLLFHDKKFHREFVKIGDKLISECEI
jgi:capsule biosynthesis phosphatase